MQQFEFELNGHVWKVFPNVCNGSECSNTCVGFDINMIVESAAVLHSSSEIQDKVARKWNELACIINTDGIVHSTLAKDGVYSLVDID